jgi:hypothetical protein
MAFALIEIIRRHQKGRSSNERSNKEMYGYNEKILSHNYQNDRHYKEQGLGEW